MTTWPKNTPKWRVKCFKLKKKLDTEIKQKPTMYDVSVKRSSTGWVANDLGVPNRKKGIWVAISPGYVYLSFKRGRAYWLLCNMPPCTRPKIKSVDRTKTIWLNTYGIKFNKPSEYEYAKTCLVPFSK